MDSTSVWGSCLVRIAGQRYLETSQSLFTKEEELRNSVCGAVRSWWIRYGERWIWPGEILWKQSFSNRRLLGQKHYGSFHRS